MKQPYSQNIVNQKGMIDVHSLPSVPPGCQKLKITGVLTIRLKIQYITKTNNKLLFKTKLWGREQQDLIFTRLADNQAVLNLSIRSSIENLSNYFSDMGIICIECFISGKQDSKEPLKTRQYSHFGRIYISLKRYIVSFILNNFEETFPIIDQRKNKVGEVIGKLIIDMSKKQNLYPIVTQPEIQHHRFQSVSISNPPSHDYDPSQRPRTHEKKDSFQPSEIAQRRQLQINFVDDQDGKRNTVVEHTQRQNHEQLIWKIDKRKGKAALFLDQYNKNKPEHSHLSLIRSKYGENIPSIEVMKLKYDEAMLLSNHERAAFTDGCRVNLLLKNLKNYSKTVLQSLVVIYQQGQQPLRTQTKIILTEHNNNKIDINYLYVHQKAKQSDTLLFEIKDAKAESSIADLKGKNTIDFKAKNGKKVATLQYSFVQEEFIPKSVNIPIKQETYQAQGKQIMQKPIKKWSGFLKVQGWRGNVCLSNKKIGAVSGPKVIYELQGDDESIVEVQLTSTKERHYLKICINHLLKEQNFIVDGRQVKITTAKGQLADLITLLSKIDSNSSKAQQVEKSSDQSVGIKDVINIFERLQKCENEECNEIIQSLTRDFDNTKLGLLVKLIDVDKSILQRVISSVFDDNFDRFMKAFMSYHNWNHRYISNQRKFQKIIENDMFYNDLQKTIKRLKRSGEVVFGIITSNVFITQFLKCERATTEQTENQFSYQQLGKLIILLLERYPTKCIKISELQNFIKRPYNHINLNAYLLLKMVKQITSNIQSFEQLLTLSDQVLINVFKEDCDGQWGLAKLILTNQEELEDSSVMSHIETERRPTDPIPHNQQREPNKTELSKESERKVEPQNTPRVPTQNQVRQNITVIISSINVPYMEGIEQIQIFSEHEGLRLVRQQIKFPRAVELIKDSTNTVIVTTSQGTFEGVFLANLHPQVVKLYKNGGVQSGELKIFCQNNSEQHDQQIIVRIEDAQKMPLHIPHPIFEPNEYQGQIKCLSPVAKSAFVKIIIRSIRPTRANYQLMITSESEQRSINYPNQNQILLRNSDTWKIWMIDQEEVEEINLTNHLASNPYCFANMRDKKVLFTAIIEVEQCWDPELSLGAQENLHLIVHFDQLLSVKPFQIGDYSLITESEPNIPIINAHNHQIGTKLNIYQSSVMESPPQRMTIKLISQNKNEQLAEFRVTLKLIESGVGRSTRYLLSCRNGYRLKLTIFQVRHRWQFCKPDRVISLFNYDSRRAIETWIRSVSEVTQEQLVVWLRTNFQLSLSQITILLEQLLNRDKKSSVEAFLETFTRLRKTYIEKLNEIKDEFLVFDYNDEGVVSEDQLKIGKKVFNRNFKQFHEFLLERQNDFIPSPQRPGNFIIDLSPAITSNMFDYLSFLDLMEGSQNIHCQDEKHKKQGKQKPEQKKTFEEGPYLSVRILQFQNLSINKLPCTFLFRINDTILADPIHKCYSFKYSSVNELVVPIKPVPQLQIFLQSLKSNGTWEYKLLETFPIAEQVKVFGGKIKFELEPTNDKKHLYKPPIPEKQFENNELNSNKHHQRNKKESARKNDQTNRSFSQSMNKQFSRSFWNKSLNQTRQKWSQWKQRKGEKEMKKSFNQQMDQEQ